MIQTKTFLVYNPKPFFRFLRAFRWSYKTIRIGNVHALTISVGIHSWAKKKKKKAKPEMAKH